MGQMVGIDLHAQGTIERSRHTPFTTIIHGQTSVSLIGNLIWNGQTIIELRGRLF